MPDAMRMKGKSMRRTPDFPRDLRNLHNCKLQFANELRDCANSRIFPSGPIRFILVVLSSHLHARSNESK